MGKHEIKPRVLRLKRCSLSLRVSGEERREREGVYRCSSSKSNLIDIFASINHLQGTKGIVASESGAYLPDHREEENVTELQPQDSQKRSTLSTTQHCSRVTGNPTTHYSIQKVETDKFNIIQRVIKSN